MLRRGQDKLADIQNILHETITGNRIVKAFSMERWEGQRFRGAAKKLFRANLRSVAAQALSSPLMDVFGAVAIALLLLLGGIEPEQVFQAVLVLLASAVAAGSLGGLVALWRDKTYQALALSVLFLVLCVCLSQGLTAIGPKLSPATDWSAVQAWLDPFVAMQAMSRSPLVAMKC